VQGPMCVWGGAVAGAGRNVALGFILHMHEEYPGVQTRGAARGFGGAVIRRTIPSVPHPSPWL
jgi:hypothetical protein